MIRISRFKPYSTVNLNLTTDTVHREATLDKIGGFYLYFHRWCFYFGKAHLISSSSQELTPTEQETAAE